MKNQHEERLELLEELLNIPGCSEQEGKVSDYLMKTLEPIVDTVQKDDHGNILAEKRYGLGKTILLSAHMDVVSPDINPNAKIIKDANIWKRESGILGADDRAGVAMIIHILKELEGSQFKGNIKIAFTTEEEIGQIGAENIDKSFFNDISYAISLDRKNGLDIVTRSPYKKYCSDTFGQFFEEQSEIFMNTNKGYRTVEGGRSDLRVWSQLGIDSVNISIGFYDEHREGEYLKINEWNRTLDFVKFCLFPLANSYNRKNNYSNNIPKVTITEKFNLNIPNGPLFYPCAGDDTIRPINGFMDTITEFHFVDLMKLPNLPKPSLKIIREAKAYEPYSTSVNEIILDQWKTRGIESAGYRGKPGITHKDEWVHADSNRIIEIYRHIQDGLATFSNIEKLAVFYLCGDSEGEGGSRQRWFQESILKLILDKLLDGGLIVTDGSSWDPKIYRTAEWKGLWQNRLDREISKPIDFEYYNRRFKCLGECGRKYGPIYVWQVNRV